MKLVLTMIAVFLFAGCVTSFTAEKADMSSFQRDNFECAQMTRELWVAPLVAAPFVAAGAQRRAEANYRRCMEIRGYVVREVEKGT